MGWKLKKPIGKDYKKTPDIEKAICWNKTYKKREINLFLKAKLLKSIMHKWISKKILWNNWQKFDKLDEMMDLLTTYILKIQNNEFCEFWILKHFNEVSHTQIYSERKFG